MDTTEEQITKFISCHDKWIEIGQLFEFYNQLKLVELLELKYKHIKNPKPEYDYDSENEDDWKNKPESWHIKRINHGRNLMALEYILFRKLGGNRPYDGWRRVNH